VSLAQAVGRPPQRAPNGAPTEHARLFGGLHWAGVDLHPAVHHRIEPGGARQCVGLEVLHADLLPQALGADLDRALRERQHVLAAPDYVDPVHRERNVLQRLVAALAEDAFAARVHRHHAPAVLLQVLADEVARPVPFGRQADRPTGRRWRWCGSRAGCGAGC
jgi:hypothetical protein